jgi:hypothetical protein
MNSPLKGKCRQLRYGSPGYGAASRPPRRPRPTARRSVASERAMSHSIHAFLTPRLGNQMQQTARSGSGIGDTLRGARAAPRWPGNRAPSSAAALDRWSAPGGSRDGGGSRPAWQVRRGSADSYSGTVFRALYDRSRRLSRSKQCEPLTRPIQFSVVFGRAAPTDGTTLRLHARVPCRGQWTSNER